MEGSKVFIPDEKECWVRATVLRTEVSGTDSVVVVSCEKLEQKEDQPPTPNEKRIRLHPKLPVLPLQNEVSQEAVEDMCDLNHLHEPALVYNLQARFQRQLPYTHTGAIVVAVNPYEWLPHLYTPANQALYHHAHRQEDKKKTAAAAAAVNLAPHVYRTSALAFANLRRHKLPQSILVSGESGSGKTETVKIMMEHLASSSTQSTNNRRIVEKILKSNPLLESFGNAKTVRNDNSSRFGKFMQLQFDLQQHMVGAKCHHYLLEKSRVIHQAKGERNYHIFYQLLAHSTKAAQYHLKPHHTVRSFHYLNNDQEQDGEFLLDGKNDADQFQLTSDALRTIGLDQEEYDCLFSILSGILHLGQVSFQQNSEEESCSPVNADKELSTCAALLGVQEDELSTRLCNRTVKAVREVFAVPLTAENATINRDALAKEIYARLFAWLVNRINMVFNPNESTVNNTQSSKMRKLTGMSGISDTKKNDSISHIDLLDIFGFECFEVNCFEQFCINFANEKLQQKFTHDVIQSIQEEYIAEGILLDAEDNSINFEDNMDLLNLFENSMGLFSLLNEECVIPKGSDIGFASKILTSHEENLRLEKDRLSQANFIIHHYAGTVKYNTTGFVSKNKDTLQSDLLQLLSSSKNNILATIFPYDISPAGNSTADGIEKGGNKKKKNSTLMQETVSLKFRNQLNLLLNDICTTEVHYVRCIKPNTVKKSGIFDLSSVSYQLRYAGMVEAIRITRSAFPNKIRHELFLQKFLPLLTSGSSSKKLSVASSSTVSGQNTVSSACTELLEYLIADTDTSAIMELHNTLSIKQKTKPYVMGKSLIYFGHGIFEFLEEKRTVIIYDYAVVLQKTARGWLTKRQYVKQKAQIVLLQSLARMRVYRQDFLKKKHAIIRLQCLWRGVFARQFRHKLYERLMATRIQCYARRIKAQNNFRKKRSAIILIQSLFKMSLQQRKFGLLLCEQQEQQKMENQLGMLTLRLEEEREAREEMEKKNSSLEEQLKRASFVSGNFNDGLGLIAEEASKSKQEQAKLDAKRSALTHQRSSIDGGLLDESGRMLEILRNEVSKLRDQNMSLKTEVDDLKSENKRIKDAYQSAGASFAALNQHNKQQSKANLRLMSTHAALIKNQEEKMKKYQRVIAELKDELRMQRNVYSEELMARVEQQDLLMEIVHLAESHEVAPEIVNKMREMACEVSITSASASNNHQPSPSQQQILLKKKQAVEKQIATELRASVVSNSRQPISNNNAQRISLASLNKSEQRKGLNTNTSSIRDSLRYHNVDRIREETPRGSDAMTDRDSLMAGNMTAQSGRPSLYYDEDTKQRKSKIGGMFKKMFKKDDS